mgnify:FL=1
MSKIEDEVCELIQARAEVGKAKYGVTMEREDLTHDEWLEHLQNELMDAVVYLQRLRTREQTLEMKLRELIQRSSLNVATDLEALLDEVSATDAHLTEEQLRAKWGLWWCGDCLPDVHIERREGCCPYCGIEVSE